MTTAQMRIDQDSDGMPTVAAGKARLDGQRDGGIVTLTSTVPGTTNRFQLLYVPPGDDTALESLVATTSNDATAVWTFAPTPKCSGPYLIELIVDEGRATEMRQRRVFGIPGWRHHLVAPALNEGGDPTARSGLSNDALATALSRTDRNVDRTGADTVEGWQRSLLDLAEAVEIGNYTQITVPAGETCIVPDGQAMLFAGSLRGDYQGDVVETSSASKTIWSPVLDTPSALIRLRSGACINRYSAAVDGMVLAMPGTPSDGDSVRLKEVTGWTGETSVFFVTVTAGGEGGEGGDPVVIESPQGVLGASMALTNAGTFLEWAYDGAAQIWRLLNYFQPPGPA